MTKTISTSWYLYTYDVWGNPKDGYEVNDRFYQGEVLLQLKPQIYNANTNHMFVAAYPTTSQIRKAIGLDRTHLELHGDDTRIYINRKRDGKPLAELICTSHESLSPIRERHEAV